MRLKMVNKKCRQCGDQLYLFPNSERTVKGGTWYEVYCPECGYRADGFKPRRSKETN